MKKYANKEDLSKAIRMWREEGGVSQIEMAKSLGMSKAKYRVWETGETMPQKRSLEKLKAAGFIEWDKKKKMDHLARDLRRWREGLGIGLRKAAAVLCVSLRSYIYWEKAEKTPLNEHAIRALMKRKRK